MLICYITSEKKTNTVGTFLVGEVNALSALSNQIRYGKSKEEKESSKKCNR